MAAAILVLTASTISVPEVREAQSVRLTEEEGITLSEDADLSVVVELGSDGLVRALCQVFAFAIHDQAFANFKAALPKSRGQFL